MPSRYAIPTLRAVLVHMPRCIWGCRRGCLSSIGDPSTPCSLFRSTQISRFLCRFNATCPAARGLGISEPDSQNSEAGFAAGAILGTAWFVSEPNFAIREFRFVNNEIWFAAAKECACELRGAKVASLFSEAASLTDCLVGVSLCMIITSRPTVH